MTKQDHYHHQPRQQNYQKEKQQHCDNVKDWTKYELEDGETEDEEVKRNCIMGQSGMSYSDFFDSDLEDDDDGDKEGKINDDHDDYDGDWKYRNNSSGEIQYNDQKEEERSVELVKFVGMGENVPSSKQGIIHRPTPIRKSAIAITVCTTTRDEERDHDVFLIDSLSDSKTNGIDDKNQTLHIEKKTESDGDYASGGSASDTETIGTEREIITGFPSFECSFDSEKETTLEVKMTDAVDASFELDKSYDSNDKKQDESETINENAALIGASGASVDDVKWEMIQQKRVLSSNTLASLNQEADQYTNSLKRIRCSHAIYKKDNINIPAFQNSILETSIDAEPSDRIIQPLPRQFKIGEDLHTFILSSSKINEVDDAIFRTDLGEKFNRHLLHGEISPPQSPLMMDGATEGIDLSMMAAIELPSNLVMDKSIIKAMNHSFVTFGNTVEKGEERYVKDRSRNSDSKDLSTPLLRSVYVPVGNTR